jgi:AbiV family abortive infection protein
MTGEQNADTREPAKPKQYTGGLTAVDAANAIRAARLNAIELYDSADVLFHLKRFNHSLALSILAIEEVAKVSIVMMVFLELGDRTKLWKTYRSHRAKTSWLNSIIESRVRASFPKLGREAAKEIGKRGPTPEFLEMSKQLALYSDTLEENGAFVSHLPSLRDWRQGAWERLCEAQAIALAARDYSPQELDVWLKHFRESKLKGLDHHSILSDLRNDLLQKGFVKEGWWDTLLQDAESDTHDS